MECCGSVDVTSGFVEACGGGVIAMLGKPMCPTVVEAPTFDGYVLGRGGRRGSCGSDGGTVRRRCDKVCVVSAIVASVAGS